MKGMVVFIPRPKKCRRVCKMPLTDTLVPKGHFEYNDETIEMSVEEYECIRLIDYEGLTQEKCAERMNMSRASVQRTYNEARKKLANCIVGGKQLIITGGDYKICDGKENYCGCKRCHRYRNIDDNERTES